MKPNNFHPKSRSRRNGVEISPTPRDESLLRTLLFKVRLLSFEQIAATWWSLDPRNVDACDRRLELLTHAAMVDERVVMAEALLDLASPIVTWSPGDAPPNVDAIAWQLQRRWTDSPSRTRVYVATKHAAGIFGGVGEAMPVIGQETHDLHVAALYLHFCRHRPEDADAWLGEEILRPFRDGEKLPDAVLVSRERQIQRVIEFGGKYDARRVAAFHHDCQNRNLPYELW